MGLTRALGRRATYRIQKALAYSWAQLAIKILSNLGNGHAKFLRALALLNLQGESVRLGAKNVVQCMYRRATYREHLRSGGFEHAVSVAMHSGGGRCRWRCD